MKVFRFFISILCGSTLLFSACAFVKTNTAPAQPETLRDIQYANVPAVDSNLTSLDIYPLQDGEKHPVMIYVHGGGWQRGDKKNVDYKPEFFNKQGFLFISVNYRLIPEVDVATQARDIARAIGWIHSNIPLYGGDPDKLFLMGHSAGAHLVSLVGIDSAYVENEGLTLKVLKGVISLDTQAYNVTELMQDQPSSTYQNAFGSDPKFWEQISPITHITANHDIPPFLAAYTGAQEERKNATEQFVEALREAGAYAELLAAPEKNHSQINQQLGKPGDQVTQAIIDFLSSILNF